MSEARKQVLSCIQPTGDMHFGNYFGAVKNWVQLQEKYDCIYGVVDYHAMTMPYKADKLRQNVWGIITNLLAVGVKPESLFIQSLVPEHTELGWIFNCFASFGEVSRMTQFKDKSSQIKEGAKDSYISVGIFDYPVLQAADILIYNADYVPVGKDQEQHLELTRNIAARFNKQVGKEYFVLPESLYTEVPKVLSTADPTRKMSKSAGDKHHINVFAEPAKMRKQIRSAVTDAGPSTMAFDEETGVREQSLGVENLFSLLKACEKHDQVAEFLKQYNEGTLSYGPFKAAVGDALVELSTKFREKRDELNADKKQIKYMIQKSSAEIRKKAQKTLKEVRTLCGLPNIKF